MKKNCNSPNCQQSEEHLAIRCSWVVFPWLLAFILALVAAISINELIITGKLNEHYIEQLNELKQHRMDSIKTNITVIITDPITQSNNVYHLH